MWLSRSPGGGAKLGGDCVLQVQPFSVLETGCCVPMVGDPRGTS